jgi:hypothetical protein
LVKKQSHIKVREKDKSRFSSKKHFTAANSNKAIVGDKSRFNELREGKTTDAPL